MTPPVHAQEGGEPPTAPCPWLTSGEVARRLHVTPTTVARWANQGLLAHRRTPGGHRRYAPELVDQVIRDLTDQARPTTPTRARPL
jgi:excisionase family DNA binding protein